MTRVIDLCPIDDISPLTRRYFENADLERRTLFARAIHESYGWSLWSLTRTINPEGPRRKEIMRHVFVMSPNGNPFDARGEITCVQCIKPFPTPGRWATLRRIRVSNLPALSSIELLEELSLIVGEVEALWPQLEKLPKKACL